MVLKSHMKNLKTYCVVARKPRNMADFIDGLELPEEAKVEMKN